MASTLRSSRLTALPLVSTMVRVAAGSVLATSALACGGDDGEPGESTAASTTLVDDGFPNATLPVSTSDDGGSTTGLDDDATATSTGDGVSSSDAGDTTAGTGTSGTDGTTSSSGG